MAIFNSYVKLPEGTKSSKEFQGDWGLIALVRRDYHGRLDDGAPLVLNWKRP